MRTTLVLNKYYPKWKYTDLEKEVRFKPKLPLELRGYVSGKGLHKTSPQCIQEMYNMMACLKRTEFEQSDCSKEIRAFNNCNSSMNKGVQYMNAEKRSGQKLVEPGAKHMPSFQLNKFMKDFPR